MSSRQSSAPTGDAIKPLLALVKYLQTGSIERPLIELVLMRASQLNGCAYCLDMHSKDARAAGETEQRLYVLQAWREAPFYSDRERAALAWCEAVTRLDPIHGVPDEVYEQARAQFSEKELGDLNMAVILINAWNRIAIPFQSMPGSYQPPKH
ncbi:carboxymuconolactone decarboxylase [Rhodanobacter sp. Root480]|jgi:AhpD family alkylhydroperoxidase|uniref:Carboxymuconolactone decarboxylase family protein n=1 Tax=Rhodanobacter ginsenosidimutans TaxID=490571 RepID=A0ABW0JYZ7_9GAMM|nr:MULTISPECIES: carboxymuconolactone decarboxylase family protein [unclassified Rhodanobacter]KQX99088.1 carboxymuconolactone decarboxylase [Rhodanobacter sp. Root480]KRA35246.1 carboxymuconolactone decarboxylase [Rhodanobacter sp. Root627]